MIITCTECGCPYDNKNRACPECGNPTPNFVNNTGITNCPNCGAPVTNNSTCEYCGSAYPRAVGSEPTVINHTTVINRQEESSAISVGAAAFLGGVVGALID